jgi:hypothetical protein
MSARAAEAAIPLGKYFAFVFASTGCAVLFTAVCHPNSVMRKGEYGAIHLATRAISSSFGASGCQLLYA